MGRSKPNEDIFFNKLLLVSLLLLLGVNLLLFIALLLLLIILTLFSFCPIAFGFIKESDMGCWISLSSSSSESLL